MLSSNYSQRILPCVAKLDALMASSKSYHLQTQSRHMLRRNEPGKLALLCAKFMHASPSQEAGHNRWSKIHRKKAVADLERSKVIQKYRNRIISTIRSGGGSDLDANIRLASLIEQAKEAGIPKATVDGAVRQATAKQTGGEHVIYEGRAEVGYMFLIEMMTENKRRTRPILRTFLTKNG